MLLGRKRFARRHLNALLLGEFFRMLYSAGQRVGAMNAFQRIGWLMGRPRPPLIRSNDPWPTTELNFESEIELCTDQVWWRSNAENVAEQFLSFLSYIETRPEEFQNAARKLTDNTPVSEQTESWSELIAQVRADFAECCADWTGDYDGVLGEWKRRAEERGTSRNISQLNALAHQARELWRTTVIEELDTRQFLPRYGFPIGVQALRTLRGSNNVTDPIRLQRDGILAVSEYVPGSTVLAGGRAVTSRAISQAWRAGSGETGFGKRCWKYRCEAGHTSYSYVQDDSGICAVPGCGAVKLDEGEPLLVARYGYSTAVWDPPKWEGNVERIGDTSLATMAFVGGKDNVSKPNFAGLVGVTATLCEGGEMLAFNRGEFDKGFAICLKCGYSESEQYIAEGRMRLPSRFEVHTPVYSERGTCWQPGTAPVLRNHMLGATHVTDLIQLDYSSVLNSRLTPSIIVTLGHALRLGGAELLDVDHRELGVHFAPGTSGTLNVYLFDNSAGGSGHVAELFSAPSQWLERTKMVMYRDEAHHARCSAACLLCLLTAASQSDMESGRLRRRDTVAVLDELHTEGRDRIVQAQPPNTVVPQSSLAQRIKAFQGQQRKR